MAEFATSKQKHFTVNIEGLKELILEHLHYTLAKDKHTATKRDMFFATAYTVRDQLVGRWIETQQKYYAEDRKRVYYLSMEFLIGRTLENSLVNLGLLENCRKAVEALGYDLNALFEIEADAGLGNGGLGRLAACFLDSMATLAIAGYGYGIRYDYGIFTQKIQDGYQIETPDNWLRYGNPWEICRSEYLYPVHFYGRVIQYTDSRGKLHNEWVDTQEVWAIAYDTPICGYNNSTVNTLRLWQAKSPRAFDLSYFNHGDYIRAVEEVALKENISKVLYPNDNIFEGQELRLKQEYFLVSATIQDIIRRYNKGHLHLDALPDKIVIQLNDTHPALAIAEMMHILIDREELSWDKAWHLTQLCFDYTNHTLLPEALERWPIPLIEKVLPRHLQIIYEINRRWLEEVDRRFPGNPEKQRALSLIEEDFPKKLNMAHLAIVGSRKINGVSALHSELLKQDVFREFYDMEPEKFTNMTNGITPRRWLKGCNPELAELITSAIGPQWSQDLNLLHALIPFEDDPSFCQKWSEVKKDNKQKLADIILADHKLMIDPLSLFDCHVKRIHEYKRQQLNILRVIHDYNCIRDNPSGNWVPRTIIFGGKAAPGYFLAKQIIKLITSVANVVNHDKVIAGRIKVLFLENYRVSLAEKIIPAADLSEQISLSGTEASGTGNMKFALNGALTIGTLDGANIEIRQEVGPNNIFIFGLKIDEVKQLKERGYNPWGCYSQNEPLRRIIDMIRDGYFSSGDTELFRPILHSLLDGGDPFCVLADFDDYIRCQNEVSRLYQNQTQWIKKSIHNVACMGHFSSDRTIAEYAKKIWQL